MNFPQEAYTRLCYNGGDRDALHLEKIKEACKRSGLSSGDAGFDKNMGDNFKNSIRGYRNRTKGGPVPELCNNRAIWEKRYEPARTEPLRTRRSESATMAPWLPRKPKPATTAPSRIGRSKPTSSTSLTYVLL